MGLGLGDGSVFHAFGHHEYFAWPEPNGAVSQLNSDMPDENQKKIVGIVVLMPNEFALDLYDHEIVPVEAAYDARLPIIRKCREFIREVDWVHDFAALG